MHYVVRYKLFSPQQDYCITHLSNETLTGIVLATCPPPPLPLPLYAQGLKQSCQPKTSAIEANRRLHQSQHSNLATYSTVLFFLISSTPVTNAIINK